MNASLSASSHPQSTRIAKRLLLTALAGVVASFAGGCAGPAKGPTDPKEFIYQRRQWTNSPNSAPAADQTAPSNSQAPGLFPPTSPDAAAAAPAPVGVPQ